MAKRVLEQAVGIHAAPEQRVYVQSPYEFSMGEGQGDTIVLWLLAGR